VYPEKITDSRLDLRIRELTKVAGRMSSSKARRAQIIPCSKVLCAATSSLSSESSSDPKTVAHRVEASSRPRTSLPATPCDKDALVSLISWISGEQTLAVPSGAAYSWRQQQARQWRKPH
jgi:hypothetical protein